MEKITVTAPIFYKKMELSQLFFPEQHPVERRGEKKNCFFSKQNNLEKMFFLNMVQQSQLFFSEAVQF